MSKYLVIVESPTKARTIGKILGKDYEVISSMGHIVDLPSRQLAIDIEHDFEPNYRTIPGKQKLLTQIKKNAKGKEIIYIATDPDREGEAIGWHIQQKLSKENKNFYRVVFHEITEAALKEAFLQPHQIDLNRVNAQISRRVLDRIVGYYLSPLLWKKIVRGLSAGRVQSVALKFIVEREKEILAFVPTTTYTVKAQFCNGEDVFSARLLNYQDQENIVFNSKEEAQKCIEAIKGSQYAVNKIEDKENKRKPASPYTTSLLQQEGFNKLRFSSQKTMLIAQGLYEGIQINEESVGLITYMRTDSVAVSDKAKVEVKDFILNSFGEKYLPEQDNRYKAKKGAQLAHEAIRPTSVLRVPEEIDKYLSLDEQKLYNLIWRRFVASFMQAAVFKYRKVYINSLVATFVAEGSKLIFDGYLKVVGLPQQTDPLPGLAKGDNLILDGLEIVEHTTKPPARFNDASLVKLLEEKGIGRPSTYAPTIYTLLRRNYLRREKAALIPTDLGIKVANILVQSFPSLINESFTAKMEEKLDKVEEGKLKWQKVIEDFFPSFKNKVEEANLTLKKEFDLAGKKCPQCGDELIVKWSRKGRFLSCRTFPQCKYAESITTEVVCPGCTQGKLIERRNKRGQLFYGCSKFPECRYTSRSLPKDTEAETQDNDENAKE